jgi:hypothetical protein
MHVALQERLTALAELRLVRLHASAAIVARLRGRAKALHVGTARGLELAMVAALTLHLTALHLAAWLILREGNA